MDTRSTERVSWLERRRARREARKLADLARLLQLCNAAGVAELQRKGDRLVIIFRPDMPAPEAPLQLEAPPGEAAEAAEQPPAGAAPFRFTMAPAEDPSGDNEPEAAYDVMTDPDLYGGAVPYLRDEVPLVTFERSKDKG